MPNIVPIALQISEEQQQVINRIAASVAPLLGLVRLRPPHFNSPQRLRRIGSRSDDTTAADNTENSHPYQARDIHGCRSRQFAKCESCHGFQSKQPTAMLKSIWR